MKDLAIVIPAYKVDFLEEALSSLVYQTNKNFNVYIGDDSSPYDIKSVVDKYWGKLNITYKRFESNLGGKDLVSQWERCIKMSQDEKWIWLFSDDDIIENNCVDLFYKTIESTESSYDIYHFDVKKINEKSEILGIPPSYPDIFDSYRFYCSKMNGKVLSFVVENVFSREVWQKTGGFQNFDLAWGSDTATWVKFMQYTGMYTIRGGHVRWRSSGQNISPNNSESMVIRKINALSEYYKWAYVFFSSQNIDCRYVNIKTYLRRMFSFRRYVSYDNIKECNQRFCFSQNMNWLVPVFNLILNLR